MAKDEQLTSRLKTGVPGLNRLLEGGLNPHTATVIIGPAGAGKTTIATQFVRRGLYDGKECIFVSLDETKDQIIRTAKGMGFTDIMDYVKDEKLFFIDVSGKSFRQYIAEELPALIGEMKGADTVIAIDPLTPVIWSTKDLYEQREIIGMLFKMTKRIGTVLATIEEHGAGQESSVIVPTYLADVAIRLRTSISGDTHGRLLRITKARDTHHSHSSHTYSIVKGFGVIVKGAGKEEGTKGKEAMSPEKILVDKRLEGLDPVARSRVEPLLRLMGKYSYDNIEDNDIIEGILDEFRE